MGDNGPWKATRYSLTEGSSDFLSYLPHELRSSLESTYVSLTAGSKETLGSVLVVAEGEWPRKQTYEKAVKRFEFDEVEGSNATLSLEETKYEGSGVGHQIWDSAIVLALY